jgi:hypothetical protein
MGSTIDDTKAAWNMKWHHVRIPLKELSEKGSWDNGTWYNPAGKFDWTRVDKFEISTEYPGTTGKQIWFDNIHISNQDTAIVRENRALVDKIIKEQTGLNLKVVPNPMKYSATISYILSGESPVSLSIFSVTGYKIRNLVNETQGPGYQSVTWDGYCDNRAPVPKGIYICIITASGHHEKQVK